jgi:hypothetical protein
MSAADPENTEFNLDDIQGGQIPREIWQQRTLQPGSALMSPVGTYSVNTLDRILSVRSSKLFDQPNWGDCFQFRKLMESWALDHLSTGLGAAGRAESGSEDELDPHVSMLDIVASKKNSALRWLNHSTIGSCEVSSS